MGDLKNDQERASAMAEILKALAHPVRLRLVALLCEGEANVGDMALKLGFGQAIASQQLRILRMSGLVDVRRENGYATYRLKETGLVNLVHCLEGCRRADH